MQQLLPLFVPLAISIALVVVLQTSVIHNAPIEQPPRPTLASAPAVIMVSSGEQRVECHTTTERVSDDWLEVHPEDLAEVIAALCE